MQVAKRRKQLPEFPICALTTTESSEACPQCQGHLQARGLLWTPWWPPCNSEWWLRTEHFGWHVGWQSEWILGTVVLVLVRQQPLASRQDSPPAKR